MSPPREARPHSNSRPPEVVPQCRGPTPSSPGLPAAVHAPQHLGGIAVWSGVAWFPVTAAIQRLDRSAHTNREGPRSASLGSSEERGPGRRNLVSPRSGADVCLGSSHSHTRISGVEGNGLGFSPRARSGHRVRGTRPPQRQPASGSRVEGSAGRRCPSTTRRPRMSSGSTVPEGRFRAGGGRLPPRPSSPSRWGLGRDGTSGRRCPCFG